RRLLRALPREGGRAPPVAADRARRGPRVLRVRRVVVDRAPPPHARRAGVARDVRGRRAILRGRRRGAAPPALARRDGRAVRRRRRVVGARRAPPRSRPAACCCSSPRSRSARSRSRGSCASCAPPVTRPATADRYGTIVAAGDTTAPASIWRVWPSSVRYPAPPPPPPAP